MNAAPYIKIWSPCEMKLVPFVKSQADDFISNSEIADPQFSKSAYYLKRRWHTNSAMYNK